jgi:S-adenosylmethionine/arginine decarboxylase-like enzyme
VSRQHGQGLASQHHLLLEFHGCDPALLSDPVDLATRLMAGDPAATLLPDRGFHAFQPQGLSGALVIGDTVLTVHTWPEQGFATIDLFSRLPLDAGAWSDRLGLALQRP